jgi:hypothetical protein
LFCTTEAPAQRAYQLLSLSTIATNDFLIVDVHDATSPTGYATKKLSVAGFLQLMGLQSQATVTTNTVTNRFEFYTTNVYQPAELQTVFSNWLRGITIIDGYGFYPSNLYGSAVCGLSDLFRTNYLATDAALSNWFATNASFILANPTAFGSNLFNLDNAYVSNWFNSILMTNPCPAAFYGSNVFAASFTNSHIDQTVSNWFATNGIISMGAYTNFAISNIWGGLSNLITQLIATNAPASNYFETNLWYPTIVYSNYNTTNITVWDFGDHIFTGKVTLTNVWIIGTNQVNYFNNTNLLVSQQYATHTNTWAGPSNVVDLRFGDLYYRTFTPLAITGLTNKVRDVFGMVLPVMLTITNAASSNVTLTLPDGMIIPQRTNSLTISNASQFMLSIRYHPLAGTNAIRQQF